MDNQTNEIRDYLAVEVMGYVEGEIYLDHADGDIAKHRIKPRTGSWLELGENNSCRQFPMSMFNPESNLNHLAMVLGELSGEEWTKLANMVQLAWKDHLGSRWGGVEAYTKWSLLLFAQEPETLCRLIVEAHREGKG